MREHLATRRARYDDNQIDLQALQLCQEGWNPLDLRHGLLIGRNEPARTTLRIFARLS